MMKEENQQHKNKKEENRRKKSNGLKVTVKKKVKVKKTEELQIKSKKMKIFADKPIKNIDEDILGREYFVDNLVKIIKSYNDEASLTIGLQGKWGSGKTSIINLTQNKLKEEKYKIINFNPWNFKGRDDLLHFFFDEMCKQLCIPNDEESLKLQAKYNNVFKKIVLTFLTCGIFLLKKIPVSPLAKVLCKVASLIKEYVESLEQPSASKMSLEQFKNEISSKLSSINTKIIVFIDDIDRLEDIEICQIFKLVNLVGNFNNVIYVLSMDKEVVVSALKNSQEKYALNYLEKIVQLPISVPDVSSLAVQGVLLKFFKSLCTQYKEELLELRNREFEKIEFLDQFETLRDVNRFINVFYVKYVSIHENVDFHDFCIITLFEIKYPQIYHFIKDNKDLFVSLSFVDRSKEIKEKILSIIKKIENLGENSEKFICNALQFLFPKVLGIGESFVPLVPVFSEEAEIKKYIFNENNFDNYFQFNKNTLIYSKNQILDIVENYSKEKFVNFVFRLNRKKQLTTVMRYISKYVKTDLSQERGAEIISWIMEISSELKEENDSSKYSVELPLDTIIPSMIIEYLRIYKNQINVFSFIKNIFTKGIRNDIELELMHFLEDDKNGVSKDIFGEDPLLSKDEILQIENLVKKDLVNFLYGVENLNNKSYIKYYKLLELIDITSCAKIIKKVSEKDSIIIKFLDNFFMQDFKDNRNGNFYFARSFTSMKPIYNKLIKDIKPDMDITKHENIVKIVFVMQYESYNPTNSSFAHFNYGDIKKYLSEVKKENQK